MGNRAKREARLRAALWREFCDAWVEIGAAAVREQQQGWSASRRPMRRGQLGGMLAMAALLSGAVAGPGTRR